MKKLFYGALAIAAIGMFAACQKDGKYNPKEKIANIYEENFYAYPYYSDNEWHSDTINTPKHLTECWTWDGNKLTQIAYFEYTNVWNGDGTYTLTQTGEDVIRFTYDGKQLTEANSNDERMVFTYDGNYLQKVEIFLKNQTTPLEAFVFEHDGKKIVKMTAVSTSDLHPDKSKPVLGRIENLLLGKMLPDVKLVERTLDKARKSGTKDDDQLVFEFIWDGDNISKMISNYGSRSEATAFAYDDKNNPYKGFVYSMFGNAMTNEGLEFASENNVVKVTYLWSYDGEDYSSEENYIYTYDGNWPTSFCNIHSDSQENSSNYNRNITYFEYK